MYDMDALELQLGDAVWMMSTGLFAGYNFKQVIEALSIETPEPIASAFKKLNDDLNAGLSLNDALEQMKTSLPSPYVSQLVAVIQRQQQTGENLGQLLKPLSEDIIKKVGSNRTLNAAMRIQAEALGATLPERVLTS